MNTDANKLADKLEKKARELRENGLTEEDMNKATGGYACECCGSSCRMVSAACNADFSEGCKNSCIQSSPD